jgi:hypothetical protein
MVQRPLPNSIQKTTSRIALMGLAAVAMIVTVSIVGVIQLQQAGAEKPFFCYNAGSNCFSSAKTCHEFQSVDVNATSRCHPDRG